MDFFRTALHRRCRHLGSQMFTSPRLFLLPLFDPRTGWLAGFDATLCPRLTTSMQCADHRRFNLFNYRYRADTQKVVPWLMIPLHIPHPSPYIICIISYTACSFLLASLYFSAYRFSLLYIYLFLDNIYRSLLSPFTPASHSISILSIVCIPPSSLSRLLLLISISSTHRIISPL